MGKRRLAVICFLWGDWPGRGLGPEYVHRLFRGVQRNLTLAHDFICFAQEPEKLTGSPFEVRKLQSPSWKGCLPKLYAYSPDAGLDYERVLILDLDNVITGSLDDIAGYDGQFCVRAWFKGWDQGLRDCHAHPELIDGDMISFRPSEISDALWRHFSENVTDVEKDTSGRERYYLRGQLTPDLWQDILPGQIVSWKNHMRSVNALPAGARIVSCHGNPRPHEIREGWIKEHWR